MPETSETFIELFLGIFTFSSINSIVYIAIFFENRRTRFFSVIGTFILGLITSIYLNKHHTADPFRLLYIGIAALIS